MSISQSIQRAAEKGGFRRVRSVEANIPTEKENISVMFAFGDIGSTFLTSSILLNRYREESKGSKYFILVSWPGFETLFPYVDEYWTLRDNSLFKRIYENTNGLGNTSPLLDTFKRELNWFFEEVIDTEILSQYYDRGITQDFFDRYKHIKRFLPLVPSANVLDKPIIDDMIRRPNHKVVIHPSHHVFSWQNGKPYKMKVKKDFWIALASRLHSEGYVPVVYTNHFTHDISADLTDKCVFLSEHNIGHTMAAMRYCGCVLDVFSGVSKIAIAARCPFICCDERQRYFEMRDYEIDDLCADKVPREYIYGFATMIESGDQNVWSLNLFDGIVAKLASFLPKLNKEELPSTSESIEIVPYASVRKRKTKRFGTRFIRVTQD